MARMPKIALILLEVRCIVQNAEQNLEKDSKPAPTVEFL
jgi:hypothetical protein